MAAEGRTAFLSSHLMSEIAQIADQLVIIGRGRLLADTTVEEVVRQSSAGVSVRVRTPQAAALRQALSGDGVEIASTESDLLVVCGLPVERIGEIAADGGVILHELTPVRTSLEDAYMRLTGDAVEYQTSAIPAPAGADMEVAA